MTTKELMEACRHAPFEIAAIDYQISLLCSNGGPGKGSSKALTGMPSSVNKPDTAQCKKTKAYVLVLKRKRQAISDLLIQFDTLLEKVPDMKDRDMLRYHYRAGWTDERISEEMQLTDRTVRARRKKAWMLS